MRILMVQISADSAVSQKVKASQAWICQWASRDRPKPGRVRCQTWEILVKIIKLLWIKWRLHKIFRTILIIRICRKLLRCRLFLKLKIRTNKTLFKIDKVNSIRANLDPIWVVCKASSRSAVTQAAQLAPLKISMEVNYPKAINFRMKAWDKLISNSWIRISKWAGTIINRISSKNKVRTSKTSTACSRCTTNSGARTGRWT